MSGELDQRVRLAAFRWLRAQMDIRGDVLPTDTDLTCERLRPLD